MHQNARLLPRQFIIDVFSASSFSRSFRSYGTGLILGGIGLRQLQVVTQAYGFHLFYKPSDKIHNYLKEAQTDT